MNRTAEENHLLRIKDLALEFHTERGNVQALDRVNLSVAKGEVLGLVGESGCGKTATARSVLGLIPCPPGRVIQGEIWLDQENLMTLSQEVLRSRVRGSRITLVPQDTLGPLNPVHTVGTQMRDILKYKGRGRNGRPDRVRSDQREILDLLRAVHLPDPDKILAKYPAELSGGQRQRILIAMAFLPRPELIIADEPTTALDVTVQAQILKIFRDLVARGGCSVLFITHDMGVMAAICDRVSVMYAGQIAETAPVRRLLESPRHPYTVKLLESVPSPEKREISEIPGTVPTLININKGCRFYDRCPQRLDKCRDHKPALTQVDEDHAVSCHLYG
ncbi:MAG: ABC transporter ATP-binding protein [Deltaproteobacteria bacterium]|nr:ABC transporter ATP-binding protein [Deltaproteobacteria bacterium]